MCTRCLHRQQQFCRLYVTAIVGLSCTDMTSLRTFPRWLHHSSVPLVQALFSLTLDILSNRITYNRDSYFYTVIRSSRENSSVRRINVTALAYCAKLSSIRCRRSTISRFSCAWYRCGRNCKQKSRRKFSHVCHLSQLFQYYKRISPSIIRAALWIIARWNIRIPRWAPPFSRNAMRFQLSKWHPHFLIWLIVLAISTRMMAMSSATDDDDRDCNERNREYFVSASNSEYSECSSTYLLMRFRSFSRVPVGSSPCSAATSESSSFEIYPRLHYLIGSCFANLKSCCTRVWWDKSLFGRQYNGPLSNITVLGLIS